MGCGSAKSTPHWTAGQYNPNDPKVAKVHEAEGKVLALMDIKHEVRDVMVNIELTRRCKFCISAGKCCGFHKELAEWPIRTLVVGAEHEDSIPIVLVHGYMMGGPCFFKWLPLLVARKRKVYCIDVIGMGGSGNPPFTADTITAEEAETLLVEPFRQWAEVMALGDVALLGHSFGGFVCSAWATRGDPRIRSLGLLSPLLGFSDSRIAGMRPEDASWQRKALLSVVESAWAAHITPHTLVRWIPGAKGFFEKNAEKRFARGGQLSEEEAKVLAEYVIATMLTPASAEKAATVCFEPMCRPVEVDGATIKSRVAKLTIPRFAVYGDRDWMDKASEQEVPGCKLLTLPGSGHHLYFDNKEGLTDLVLAELPEGKRT